MTDPVTAQGRKGDWMQTLGGGQFWPTDPRPGDFDISEIGHALSMICRFNGHCPRFYSVAQHCVLVSELVPAEYALSGLLHDAAEAYVGDVTRPLKGSLPGYGPIEAAVERALATQFGIDWPWPTTVKNADTLALAIEQRDVMARSPYSWRLPFSAEGHSVIHPLPPLEARVLFEQRWKALS